MFACEDKWYREVLDGFASSYGNKGSNAVDLILSVIAPGKNLGSEVQEIVFTNLSEYLSFQWRKKRYREILNFLICARGSNLIDVDKLDKALCNILYPRMDKVINISKACAEKAKDKGYFTYSFKDWAVLVYSNEVLGIKLDIDIDNITNHDIDKIQEIAGDNSHFLFRPMLQHLIENDRYEQLWYLLNQYIIPSFCSKNCRTDKEVARSLSLFIGELNSVLGNISYINQIDLFLSKKDILNKMLKASKDGDTNTFDKSIKELLFKDTADENLKICAELAENLITLFYHAIKNNELISREFVEYFCSLILAVMVMVGLYNKASDFICANKEYIQFFSLDKMLLIAFIALRSDNLETVNMIYGIFLTEKTYIDNLRITLSSYLKECVNFLTGIYNRCSHEKKDSFFNGMLARYEKSSDYNIEIETKEKTIEIFKNKFFVQCGVLALCEEAEDISNLSDIELIGLTNKLIRAVKCICEDGSLKTIDTGEKITFSTYASGYNAALDEEHYIETYFTENQDIRHGKRIINNFEINQTKFSNLKYRNTYDLMNYALLEKQTSLYLENMSGIIEKVLNEKPDKYKIYLSEKWDEQKAEKIFAETFKSNEILDYIPGNLRHCLLRPNRNHRIEYCRRELINYLEDSYKKAGDLYEQVFGDPETKGLLIAAEWLWHNEHKSYEYATDEIRGHEFTYLIANYLKAIELYIVFRLNQYVSKTGRSIEIEHLNRREKLQVGSPGWEQMVTMGGLYRCIKDNPELLNDDLRIKIHNYIDANNNNTYYNHPVFNYLKYFTDEIRNGYFHKDTVLDFSKAADLRAKTLFVLKRIVADLKDIY
ncbi:MAG: hypothetical protein GX957_12505 [Clostridiaceae bacterium]|nr:hypothetical protein [Clostridiaceae bacterium]